MNAFLSTILGLVAPVAPTYHGDVAAILQAKCQACHRPGQAGPFILENYTQAKRWSSMIAEVVEADRMPPWHADPQHGRFANDRRLDDAQKQTLLAWIDADCPEGDPATAPPPRVFASEWSIGTPDVVLTMPRSFSVPASGTLRYQHFLVPTNFEEDKWVAAAEIRPGAKGAVHHILVFVLGRGEELGTEPDPERNGRGQQLAGYVPGDIPSRYPAGMAKKIPAGARLLFQVHYTPIGKPVEDRSAIGLVFADGPVERQVLTKGIAQRSLSIPPNAPDHAVRSQYRVPAGSLLLSLSPHMHLRGKDFTYKAEYPDGRSEVLLSVPRYDFNWQTRYNLAEPKRLPAGTTIACLAHYDNSDGNKANPDPSRTVRWGPQTTDEMMIGYVDLAPDRPIDSADPDPDPDPAAPARGDRAPMMQIVESLDLDADQRQQLRGLFREYRGRYRTPEFRKAAEAILTPEQRAAWQARRREDDQPEGTRP